MTTAQDLGSRASGEARDGEQSHAGHSGHGWMMIACCIPLLVIAIALVAMGVANASFLVAATACTAMMTLMMRGMGHGGDGR